MKKRLMQKRPFVAGLVLSAALGGCAVLSVDVDVYKGALVNEEHVQLHQLVALATAAKPMLIQLRDNLEWPKTDGRPPEGATTCGKDGKSWYRAGYIQPPNDFTPEILPESLLYRWFGYGEAACYPHFRDIRARLVNSALSLYEDLDSPDFAPHGAKLRAALNRLERTMPNAQDDQKAFNNIARGFKADTALVTDGLSGLKKGYEQFLIASGDGSVLRRNIRPLMDALRTFQAMKKKDKKSEEPLVDKLIKNWPASENGTPDETPVYDQRTPIRAAWKFLGEGEINSLLAPVSKQLCVDNADGKRACEELMNRTKELVESYWESRQATRDLWEEGLNLLVVIQRLEQRLEKGEPDRYYALRKQLINLVLKLTHVQYVASALDRVEKADQCAVLKSLSVLDAMCAAGPDGKLRWTEANVKRNPHYFKEALRQALTVHPEETAYFLLYLDSIEKDALPTTNAALSSLVTTANATNPQRTVRLGLTLSLVDSKDVLDSSIELLDSTELFALVDQVNHNLANGFERGRLVQGLHTLTKDFLTSHSGATRTTESDEQRLLTDNLVEFAQKVLFLANHDWLVSPPRDAGLILGGGENILRGLLGDYAIGKLSRSPLLGPARIPESEERGYIRVLQAVGNSILFSANELRERNRYDDASKAKVPAEVDAANAVYSPSPGKVLDGLLKELESEKQLAQKQLTEAQAKKNTLTDQIGKDNPATGQYQTVERAKGDVTAAQTSLDTYQQGLQTLNATHTTLTKDVQDKIKAQWKISTAPSATTTVDFLTDGSHGLKKKLADVRSTILTSEEKQTFDHAETFVALPDSATAFEAYRATTGAPSMTRADLLDAFAAHIAKLEAERVQRVTRFEQARNEKKQRQQEAEHALAQLLAEQQRIERLISQLPTNIERVENAHMAVGDVRTDTLRDAENANRFATPDAVYSLLTSRLEKKSTGLTAHNNKPYQDALAVLATRTPPPGMPPLNRNDYHSPLDVMDKVIALLRHRHMEAVERFGKDSPDEKKATETLENAYRHRAGMIYIRPSSAYLRTSFPSTSLQDDPNLAWDNMVLKQGIRALPFSSQLRDLFNPVEKQDRAITSELDKQYWQNINRVRVAGAGQTNQALVKDDVGNWYVKQYFGDTKDIINSAKNLALFNLGTKLPIDLPNHLRNLSDSENTNGSEKQDALVPLQRVLDKHKAAYQTNTAEAVTKLGDLHSKNGKGLLRDRIVTAWESVGELKDSPTMMRSLKTALDTEIAEWDKTADALKSVSGHDPGHTMLKDIRALSKMEKQLGARIRDIDGTQALKTKATTEVGRVLGPLVLELLEDRKRTVDRFQQAVLFIGDVANPKEPNAKQSSHKYEDIRK